MVVNTEDLRLCGCHFQGCLQLRLETMLAAEILTYRAQRRTDDAAPITFDGPICLCSGVCRMSLQAMRGQGFYLSGDETDHAVH